MKVIYLIHYAPQALKGMMQNLNREAAIKALFESVGGQFSKITFTHGAYDALVEAEVSDHNASMAALTAVRATGSINSVVALDVVDMPAVLVAASKAAAVFTPAG